MIWRSASEGRRTRFQPFVNGRVLAGWMRSEQMDLPTDLRCPI